MIEDNQFITKLKGLYEKVESGTGMVKKIKDT